MGILAIFLSFIFISNITIARLSANIEKKFLTNVNCLLIAEQIYYNILQILKKVSKLKVLVTGGAGFIGSGIANSLARNCGATEDCEVLALDNLFLGSITNIIKGVRFVNGSVLDYRLILDLTKQCDYVFHDAGLSSSPMFLKNPRQAFDVNVMGFMNIMEASKRNKVKKVIFASSSSLYNGLPLPFKESYNIVPRTFYESSFYCREVIAKTYYLENEVNSIGLRYFSVYGLNERHKRKFANNISQFLWTMKEGRSPIIYGDGLQTRDFTFIDDVVSANKLAMRSKKEHGIYNIGTGSSTSFMKLVELLNASLHTNIKPTFVPTPIRNYVKHTKADTTLAKTELGYDARWTIGDGIKKITAPDLDERLEMELAQKLNELPSS